MAPASRAFYLDAGGEAVLVRHDAPAGAPSGRGVVLVPPFGWDEVCSYRPRWSWARHLAARGTGVVRLDLPGGGDSAGGPSDDDRLGAWTTAVTAACAWMAGQDDGTDRITLVGLGLGGFVGWQAVAAGAAADDLVLWGVTARGRSHVREVKAFSRLERSRLAELNPGRELAGDEDGAITAGGFVLSAATIAVLEATELRAPGAPWADRRVLVLGRDGAQPDARLVDAARATGAEVAHADGPGWGAMVAEPGSSTPPWAAIAAVDAFLDAGPAGPAGHRARSAAPAEAAEAIIDGVRETPVRVGGVDGVLAEPAQATGPAPVTLLLLNAGSIRRIGPNRMWVELARRWAARGVPSVRLDLPGIGEADGPDSMEGDVGAYYGPEFVAALHEVLDRLAAREGSRRFGAIGLCSGAYWSLQAAIEDERIDRAYLLNTRALVWDPDLGTLRDTRKLGYLAKASTYRRVLRGDIPLRRGAEIARAMAWRLLRALGRQAARAARREPAAPPADPVDAVLDRLRDDGKRGYLLFTGAEPVHEELERTGHLTRLDRWPNLVLETLPELRDVHELKPRELQREVHARLDAAIERDLQAAVRP
ncbi:hypothetical protein FSW04_06810 [Baekduia soli]|uniref:Alpha/beta hydrolase n=1 Tax=Baekduia soli TaxID=496014 RepID=A0A5B8U2U0_9ACTN|nr:hypothetical protein [Baekduia soli]QEC47324.1 hypothetical protein FSW04_06810 [Baekduia soli]